MAAVLDGAKLVEKMSVRYSEYFDGEKNHADMTQQLSSFINEVIGETCVTKLLKACNQVRTSRTRLSFRVS